MFRSLPLLISVSAFLFCFSCDASAQNSVTEEAKALFEDVKEARSFLVSGKFRAKGYAKLTKPEHPKPINLPAKIECMFDNDKKLLRIECQSKALINPELITPLKARDISRILAIRRSKDPQRFVRKPYAGFLLKNREYVTIWHAFGNEGTPDSYGTHITLFPLSFDKAPSDLHYFDPAAVGLLDPRDFSTSKTRNLKQILDAYLKELPVVDLETGEKGLVTVICQNKTTRGSITIDTQKGYTISRMRLQQLAPDGSPRPLPLIESTGDWKQKDSIWIPVHFKSEMRFRDGRIDQYKYDIEWIDINPEFNAQQIASLFTYKSFPELVWKNTQVFAYRPIPNRPTAKRLEQIDTIGAPFKKAKSAIK